ncbi:MAG: hypothetical protein JOZ47_23140 [Kutzneria sp.]|nr:hypothetical protein [Kutzneria sp.]MBV9847937.1 hypothetical protein [Kutzneria sp.]
MDTGRALFLLAGVIIVAVVGRLLVYGGRRYLSRSAPAERESAQSAATLVSVLFHLLTLGLVSLIAVIPFHADDQQNFLLRIGFLLIVLAVAYGLALSQLSRRRQEVLAAELDTHFHESEQRVDQPDRDAAHEGHDAGTLAEDNHAGNDDMAVGATRREPGPLH